MPQIPTYDSPKVAPQVGPSGALNIQAPNLIAPVAQGAANLVSVYDQVAQHADSLAAEDKINQLVEAKTQLTLDKNKGFVTQLGSNVLPGNRTSNMSLSGEYMQEFSKSQEALAEQLANPRQKEIFRRRANLIGLDFQHGLESHETTQIHAYASEVADGTVKSAVQDAQNNWNNPDIISQSLQRIDASLTNVKALNGTAGAKLDVLRHDFRSMVSKGVLQGALESKNLSYADTYLKSALASGDINVSDALKFRGQITHEMNAATALQVRDTVFSEFRAGLQPTEFDRFRAAAGSPGLTDAVMKVESGGNQSAVSPKGAKGAMQVMDATNTDPGYGVTPAKDNSLAERDRVGRDYLTAMLTHFGGDPAKALAAYNAGPGAVEDAIKRAASGTARDPMARNFDAQGNAIAHGGTVGPNDWLKLLPKETQDYVPKVMSGFAGGTTAPPVPSLTDLLARGRALAGNDPERWKLVEGQIKDGYAEMMKTKSATEDAAVSNALKGLDQNGGNFESLPLATRMAIPGQKLAEVRGYGEKIAQGSFRPTNLAVYQKLSTDEAYLGGLTDDQFFRIGKTELSPEDFKHFSTKRDLILTGKSGNSVKDLNYTELRRVVDNRLQGLGIDPTPKDTDTSAMSRVAVIRQFLDQEVLKEQRNQNKRLLGGDLEKFIDGQFLKSEKLRSTFLGFSYGDPSGVRRLTMTVNDIPSDVKDALKTDFGRRGISAPSDADLLGAFWSLKAAAPGGR